MFEKQFEARWLSVNGNAKTCSISALQEVLGLPSRQMIENAILKNELPCSLPLGIQTQVGKEDALLFLESNDNLKIILSSSERQHGER